MNIITGYRAEPHITAQQDRDVNIGIFGASAKILKGVGSEMAATVISANEVEIADGTLVAEGCTAEIQRGTTESVTIENGEQGKKRIDLIVARYTRDSGTAVESMALAVIKGTSAATNPAVPSYNTGTIADGDSPVDFPLYRVHLDGISITSVERLADVVSIKGDMDSLAQRITDVEAHMPEHIEYTWEYTNIGINANGAYSATKRIGITGYTPNAIKGFRILNNDTNGKNAGWCIFPKLWVYNNALDFTVWNQHPSQQAIVKVQIKIDYVSNNSV